jgi:3-hydroxyacyl-CoA dehydrogenase
MTNPFHPRRAAVLGAGVMGAQIAAHLVNADIPTVLFELAAPGDDPRAGARKAVTQLARMNPAPLSELDRALLITPATYETDLGLLGDCDLVIEAVAEIPEVKEKLFATIAPHLGPDTVLATNTSGLSLAKMQEILPEEVRQRFLGIHFFNPPRYMHLVEVIPGPETDSRLLNQVETFLITRLGKGVVRAKDTPNFIGNRIGVFSIVATFHHAARTGLPFDVVDELTGPAIGRAKSATYRTADVVGLDTLAHVIEGSGRVLKDDPWRQHLRAPDWLRNLVVQGARGQKDGAGVFKKQGRDILVYDPSLGDYRPRQPGVAPEVQAILAERDPTARFGALRNSEHPQAAFLWCIHRDLWHYAAYHLAAIAHNARDVDLALRWGFGWKAGPFEQWQAAGWGRVASWISADIAAGVTMASAPLPLWVLEREDAHTPAGSYDATQRSLAPRSSLPVYRRQLFPHRVLSEPEPRPGDVLLETDAIRLVRRDGGAGLLSLKTKLHTLGIEAVDGLLESLSIAEADLACLVLWHDAPFSAGANLVELIPVLDAEELDRVDAMVGRFQELTRRLRECSVPDVAAAQGLALGGGCELLLHVDRVVASLELYTGLVEAGVGLLPAAGGLTELARRASLRAGRQGPFPFIAEAFELVAKGRVSTSAHDAQALGLLLPADIVVLNDRELPFAALEFAKGLAATGYRPPLPRPITVAGRSGLANIQGQLTNLHAGGFISDHDVIVSTAIGRVLCGGDVEPGTAVSADYLLALEREAFVELCRTPATRARIRHMLERGKPLRN